MTGVSTGERCQPTRGVINPHRSAGRHLFRFSYYSFYKTARTKRHRSYSTAENKPELEVKGLKKGRQSTHTSKSGYQSLITWFKQSERTQRRILAQRSCSRRGVLDKQVHSGVNWTQSGTKLKAAELWMKTSSPLFVFLLTIFHLF